LLFATVASNASHFARICPSRAPLPATKLTNEARTREGRGSEWRQQDGLLASIEYSIDPSSLHTAMSAQTQHVPALSNVEAQRVLAVIDHLIRDLDLAFLVPSKVTASSTFDVSTLLSSDSLKSLRKQHELETSLLSILSRTGGNIPDASQDSEDEPISQEWSLTAKALQKNVRDICREFRNDPELTSRMRAMNLAGSATESFSQFRALVMQLRTQVIISLSKSVEEQRAEQQAFIITEGREKRLGQEVKSSTKELTALLAEKAKTIKIRDDQILQYTSEMKDLESAKRMATEQSKSVSENKVLVDQHNEAKASLLKVTKAKTEEFDKLKTGNVEKEEAQRKRSFKRETDVETWVVKYDTDLGQLQADYNDAQSSYIAEKARMREIEDHFDRFRWEECGKVMLQCEKEADAVRAF